MNSKNQSIRSKPQVIKAKGSLNSGVGKTKRFVGDITHSPNLEMEGRLQETKGFGQKKQGSVKVQLQKISFVVGDGFKKAGIKLQQRGYGRAGKALEKVGSNLEGYGA